jgi:hypothetical protein
MWTPVVQAVCYALEMVSLLPPVWRCTGIRGPSSDRYSKAWAWAGVPLAWKGHMVRQAAFGLQRELAQPPEAQRDGVPVQVPNLLGLEHGG